MTQKFANAARTELAAGIASGDTTLTLADGSPFPDATVNTGALTAGDWFKIVLQDSSGLEVCYVRTHATATAPNSFTNVLRAQDGTTARAFSAGAVVGLRQVASDLADTLAKFDTKSDTSHTHAAATGSTAGFLSATDKGKLDKLVGNKSNRYYDWIKTLQIKSPGNPGDGALIWHDSVATIADGVSYYRIEPYFSSLAVYFLLEAAPAEFKGLAAAWINWWVGHVTTHSGPFVAYTTADGVTVATALPTASPPVDADAEDATDSNLALWLLCVARYVALFEVDGLVSTIQDDVNTALTKLQSVDIKDSTDGLTWARADYKIKYVMDNTEVLAAVKASINLIDHWGVTSSAGLQTWADQMMNTFLFDLWDGTTWAIYKDEAGTVTQAGHDLSVVYPDALVQLWPSLYNIDRTRGGYPLFNEKWPGWVTGSVAGAGATNDGAIAVVALIAGDVDAAKRWATVRGTLAYPSIVSNGAFTALALDYPEYVWPPHLVDNFSPGLMSVADHAKVAGVAVDATKNQTDAYLLDRTNHTGTQALSTIDGMSNILDASGSNLLLNPSGGFSLTDIGSAKSKQLEINNAGAGYILPITSPPGAGRLPVSSGGAGTLMTWVDQSDFLPKLGKHTLSTASSLLPDGTVYDYFEFNALASDITISAPNMSVGTQLVIVLKPVTATRTVTFNAAYKFSDATSLGSPTSLAVGYTYHYTIHKTNAGVMVSWFRAAM